MAPPEVEGPSITVEHAWGKTKVPLAPTRIVVLDLSFLDAMTSLEQELSGYAGISNKEMPKYLLPYMSEGPQALFVGERKQPNLELILSLNPQLIIANPDRHKLIRNSLETLAPTIALQDNSLSEVREMLRVLGDITQKQERAQKVLEELDTAIEHSKELSPAGKSVLLLGAFEDEFTTWTAHSFMGTLLQEIGLNYAFTGASTASESQTEVAKITMESLSKLDPDIVFLYGSDKLWLENPVYMDLKAFKAKHIFKVDRDIWSRSRGPLAALEILKLYEQFLSQKKS